MRLSDKQAIIIAALIKRPTITLDDAVQIIGHGIYYNPRSYVGKTLARLVNRGLIERISPGVFCLSKKLRPLRTGLKVVPRTKNQEPSTKN